MYFLWNMGIFQCYVKFFRGYNCHFLSTFWLNHEIFGDPIRLFFRSMIHEDSWLDLMPNSIQWYEFDWTLTPIRKEIKPPFKCKFRKFFTAKRVKLQCIFYILDVWPVFFGRKNAKQFARSQLCGKVFPEILWWCQHVQKRKREKHLSVHDSQLPCPFL